MSIKSIKDMTPTVNTLVESAKELKEAGYDIRALLEDAGVFMKIMLYCVLVVCELILRFDLGATVEEIGHPSFVA